MGQLVDQLVNSFTAELPLTKGLDYRALPKDQLPLMSTLGILYKDKNGHVFKFPIFEKGKSHVSINTKGRMECDDFSGQSGFTSAGSWQYYIR